MITNGGDINQHRVEFLYLNRGIGYLLWIRIIALLSDSLFKMDDRQLVSWNNGFRTITWCTHFCCMNTNRVFYRKAIKQHFGPTNEQIPTQSKLQYQCVARK